LPGDRGVVFWRLLLSAVLVLAAASATLAQTTGNATLRGTVKDEQGAVVAKAPVTLINEATKASAKQRLMMKGCTNSAR
jgi:hypothetical protein